MLRLCLITDPSLGDFVPALAAALAVLPRGGVLVQLRDKQGTAAQLLAQARALSPLCRAHGAPLLVNDRADVALAAGADGVHLPANGLPVGAAREVLGAKLGAPSIVGVSCHTVLEIAAAARAGADYCLFGPVWPTPGKLAQGVEALRAAVRAAPIPVLALGGVSLENASQAMEAGAAGVACIRSVLGARDPAAAAIALWQAVSP